MYEKRSDKMAEIARNYHEGLQKDEEATDRETRENDIEEVLESVKVTIPIAENKKLAENVTSGEVRQAIRDLPD